MKRDFIASSMLRALAFLKDATLSEEHANRQGFLQSLDPRIKTLTMLALLVTAVSLKSAGLIALIYLSVLALAIFSAIPATYFLTRTLLFIPLFSLLIVLPTIFSQITPGQTAYSIQLLGFHAIITRPGLDGAILFVTRTATSVSVAVLLSLTTRHAELLKVLRIFRIPQVFVLTVAMCYRYLYLFATMVENIFTALRSRVGIVSRSRHGRHLATGNIATTWNRTTAMSEGVYMAMLSRGYTGEPRLLTRLHATRKDWVWLLATATACVALLHEGGIP
ncbi:cobalt ECF transporter T component CbiQ [Pelodictyon luteolum]|nr:cobalt ECF transporter T component CbiQ [Pelodictyon luteolum]